MRSRGQAVAAAVRELVADIAFVASVAASDLDWEYKYDVIFMGAPELREKLSAVGLRLDYCDPDSSYEDDVRAYVAALGEVRAELEALLVVSDLGARSPA